MDVRELVQRATDTWNSRDQEAFEAFYADDCEVTAPGFTGKGRQGLREFWALWNGAFPDNRVTRRTVVVEGDTVAEMSQFQGTNTGPLTAPDGSEIPPTGRPVAVSFSLFTTVRDDLIATSTFHIDQMEMLGQLGLA